MKHICPNKLRGKMINLITAGSIKRPQLYTVNKTGEQGKTVGNIETREKQKVEKKIERINKKKENKSVGSEVSKTKV